MYYAEYTYMEIDLIGNVAQMVEQDTENVCVGGSLPSIATTLIWGRMCQGWRQTFATSVW